MGNADGPRTPPGAMRRFRLRVKTHVPSSKIMGSPFFQKIAASRRRLRQKQKVDVHLDTVFVSSPHEARTLAQGSLNTHPVDSHVCSTDECLITPVRNCPDQVS